MDWHLCLWNERRVEQDYGSTNMVLSVSCSGGGLLARRVEDSACHALPVICHALVMHIRGVGDRMGPVPYGPIMTSSAISKSPIWFQ